MQRLLTLLMMLLCSLCACGPRPSAEQEEQEPLAEEPVAPPQSIVLPDKEPSQDQVPPAEQPPRDLQKERLRSYNDRSAFQSGL